jgi:hypothetical protein
MQDSVSFPMLVVCAFDAALALLLAATIGCCLHLSRRMRQMQESRHLLADMIARFDEATERATRATDALRETTRASAEQLQTRMDKADFIAGDLAFMIEKGGKLAEQLGQTLLSPPSPTRPAAVKPVPTPVPPPPASPAVTASLEAALARLADATAPLRKSAAPLPAYVGQPRTRAERELIAALKGEKK